jgi:hypothetical protein
MLSFQGQQVLILPRAGCHYDLYGFLNDMI